MNSLNQLVEQYGYVALAVGVGGESMGLPLPGETTLVATAVYAAVTHRLSPSMVVVVASLAAILGDNIGFWIGRRFGPRLVTLLHRRRGRRAQAVASVQRLFDRHSSSVIVGGRFVSVVRTYTAILAGNSGMRWRRFATLNASSAIVWAALFGFGAAALGTQGGLAASIAAASIVVAAGIGSTVALGRHRRFKTRADSAPTKRAGKSGPDSPLPSHPQDGDTRKTSRRCPSGDASCSSNVLPRWVSMTRDDRATRSLQLHGRISELASGRPMTFGSSVRMTRAAAKWDLEDDSLSGDCP